MIITIKFNDMYKQDSNVLKCKRWLVNFKVHSQKVSFQSSSRKPCGQQMTEINLEEKLKQLVREDKGNKVKLGGTLPQIGIA